MSTSKKDIYKESEIEYKETSKGLWKTELTYGFVFVQKVLKSAQIWDLQEVHGNVCYEKILHGLKHVLHQNKLIFYFFLL